MGAMTCLFCSPSAEEIVLAKDLCYSRYDKYPLNPGHLLIVPFRHIAGFFDAKEEEEQAALLDLVRKAKRFLDERFCPDGYNIG